MNDAHLEAHLQKINAELEEFSKLKELTKEQRIHKQILVMQKQTLNKISEAKEKGNWQQEIRSSVDYSLLTEFGEKHPFLAYLLRAQSWWWGL